MKIIESAYFILYYYYELILNLYAIPQGFLLNIYVDQFLTRYYYCFSKNIFFILS